MKTGNASVYNSKAKQITLSHFFFRISAVLMSQLHVLTMNLVINIMDYIIFLASARSSGYSIYIYDTNEIVNLQSPANTNLIYQHDPRSGCPSTIKNITVNRVGQEILFFNSRTTGYISNCEGDEHSRVDIEICEVKVMGKLSLKS